MLRINKHLAFSISIVTDNGIFFVVEQNQGRIDSATARELYTQCREGMCPKEVLLDYILENVEEDQVYTYIRQQFLHDTVLEHLKEAIRNNNMARTAT